MRQHIEVLLDTGISGQENLLGTLPRLGAQLMAQEALEQETTEQLGRADYEHCEPGQPLGGYRNR